MSKARLRNCGTKREFIAIQEHGGPRRRRRLKRLLFWGDDGHAYHHGHRSWKEHRHDQHKPVEMQ